MRQQKDNPQPRFEFRIAENAETCGSVLGALAALLVEIDESKQAEQAGAKQEGGDACQTQTT